MSLLSSKTTMKSLGTQEGLRIFQSEISYLLLPNEPTDRVIISAHGGHAMLTKTNSFTVPSNVVLRFYSDDTKSVLDPGFNNFYRGEAAPKEIITEGDKCFDYLLTKYQGKHGAKDETYESIAAVINESVKARAQLLGKAASTSSSAAKGKFLQAASREKVAAVVTIRNRRFRGDATLSMIIDGVKKHTPSIVIFDCLFCRSTMRGGSDAVPIVARW
jgi:hypothetical protein